MRYLSGASGKINLHQMWEFCLQLLLFYDGWFVSKLLVKGYNRKMEE